MHCEQQYLVLLLHLYQPGTQQRSTSQIKGSFGFLLSQLMSESLAFLRW